MDEKEATFIEMRWRGKAGKGGLGAERATYQEMFEKER